ncbi:MAG: hypothetical protein WCJ09_18210 [Planctomycetota bacterium]
MNDGSGLAYAVMPHVNLLARSVEWESKISKLKMAKRAVAKRTGNQILHDLVEDSKIVAPISQNYNDVCHIFFGLCARDPRQFAGLHGTFRPVVLLCNVSDPNDVLIFSTACRGARQRRT